MSSLFKNVLPLRKATLYFRARCGTYLILMVTLQDSSCESVGCYFPLVLLPHTDPSCTFCNCRHSKRAGTTWKQIQINSQLGSHQHCEHCSSHRHGNGHGLTRKGQRKWANKESLATKLQMQPQCLLSFYFTYKQVSIIIWCNKGS